MSSQSAAGQCTAGRTAAAQHQRQISSRACSATLTVDAVTIADNPSKPRVWSSVQAAAQSWRTQWAHMWQTSRQWPSARSTCQHNIALQELSTRSHRAIAADGNVMDEQAWALLQLDVPSAEFQSTRQVLLAANSNLSEKRRNSQFEQYAAVAESAAAGSPSFCPVLNMMLAVPVCIFGAACFESNLVCRQLQILSVSWSTCEPLHHSFRCWTSRTTSVCALPLVVHCWGAQHSAAAMLALSYQAASSAAGSACSQRWRMSSATQQRGCCMASCARPMVSFSGSWRGVLSRCALHTCVDCYHSAWSAVHGVAWSRTLYSLCFYACMSK
jgi:hypothetical protein